MVTQVDNREHDCKTDWQDIVQEKYCCYGYIRDIWIAGLKLTLCHWSHLKSLPSVLHNCYENLEVSLDQAIYHLWLYGTSRIGDGKALLPYVKNSNKKLQ